MASQSAPASPISPPYEPPFPEDENHLDTTTEFIENYGPGLLHPVHLGDLFKGGRYRILRKLGYGVYSTVWLARDHEEQQYVALKISTSESNSAGQEVRILKHLSTQSPQHPDSIHVIALLDSFEHPGPNGIHECFVFEVMGASAGSYLEDLPGPGRPSSLFDRPQEVSRRRLSVVKQILRQALLGLGFLHTCGIVHGDLQPGNVLVSIQDLSSIEESKLTQYDEDAARFVKVPDGDQERFVRVFKDDQFSDATETELRTPDAKRQKVYYSADNGESAPEKPCRIAAESSGVSEKISRPLNEGARPRYIALKRPLKDIVDVASPLQVKISDMGGAFFSTSPPEVPVTPLGMRSPELILGRPLTKAQDIWSFGCLVFELLANRPLFIVDPFDYSKMSDFDDEEYRSEDGDEINDNAGSRTQEACVEDGSNRNNNAKDGFQENKVPQQNGDDKVREYKAGVKPNSDTRPIDISTQDTSPEKEGEKPFSYDADHLQQFACALRPLPPSILSQFPLASFFFEQNGQAKLVEGVDGKDVPPAYSLETLLHPEKSLFISAGEESAIAELIRYILQYEPEERPTVAQLLEHPWFVEDDHKDACQEV